MGHPAAAGRAAGCLSALLSLPGRRAVRGRRRGHARRTPRLHRAHLPGPGHRRGERARRRRADCSSPPTTPVTPAGSSRSTRSGTTVGVTRWSRHPTDVEALAPAGRGCVWVGDIGDNLARRPHVTITRIPVGRGDRTVRRTSYRLDLPAGRHERRDPDARPRDRAAVRRHQEPLRRHGLRRTPASDDDRSQPPQAGRPGAADRHRRLVLPRRPPPHRPQLQLGHRLRLAVAGAGRLVRPAVAAPGRGHRGREPGTRCTSPRRECARRWSRPGCRAASVARWPRRPGLRGRRPRRRPRRPAPCGGPVRAVRRGVPRRLAVGSSAGCWRPARGWCSCARCARPSDALVVLRGEGAGAPSH